MNTTNPTAAQVTLALEVTATGTDGPLLALAQETIAVALRKENWTGGDIPYGTAVDEHVLLKLRAFAAIRDILFLDESLPSPTYNPHKLVFDHSAMEMIKRAVLEAEPSVRDASPTKG
jgi:hypothetical protein